MKTLSIAFIILLFICPKLAAALGLALVLGFLCGLLKITYTVKDGDKEKESDR